VFTASFIAGTGRCVGCMPTICRKVTMFAAFAAKNDAFGYFYSVILPVSEKRHADLPIWR
jgi:hypothetical protein